jgi:hypothetical protein
MTRRASGVGALVGDAAHERRRRDEFGGELLLSGVSEPTAAIVVPGRTSPV